MRRSRCMFWFSGFSGRIRSEDGLSEAIPIASHQAIDRFRFAQPILQEFAEAYFVNSAKAPFQSSGGGSSWNPLIRASYRLYSYSTNSLSAVCPAGSL